MSDSPIAAGGTPQADPASKAPGDQSAAKPAPRKRRWRRRLIWTGLILLALVMIGRILVVLLLPTVLQKVAARFNLTCTYERTDMYLIDGDVGLWNLTIAPRDGGEPLLRADYCRADVAALPLLRGRLIVRRAEAEGIDLLLERKADGTIPILQHLPASLSAPPPATATPSTKPIDLGPPLKIDIFRLQQVRVHLRDPGLKPALDTQLEMNMRLTDLGATDRPTRLTMDLTSDPVLDSLRIEAEGRVQSNALDAKIRVSVNGLHPRPLEGYLRPLGFQASADAVSMRMAAMLHVTPATRAGALAGRLVLDDLSAIADGNNFFNLHQLALDVDSVDGLAANLRRISIDGVRCKAERGPDGGLQIAGFGYKPSTAPAAERRPEHAVSVAASSTQPSSTPFGVSLGSLSIHHVDALFSDHGVSPPTQLALLVDEIDASGSTSEPSGVVRPGSIKARIRAPGLAGLITLDGAFGSGAEDRTAEMKLRVGGINLVAIRPYLEAMGVDSLLEHGEIACDAKVVLSPGPGIGLSDARLDRVTLRDATTELFALDGVHVANLAIDPAKRLLKIGAMEITGPRFAARRDPQGNLSLLGFRTRPTPAPTVKNDTPVSESTAISTATTQPEAAAPAQFPRLEIDRFSWKKIGLLFDDQAAKPPVSLKLNDAQVELSGLVIDPNSTTSNTPPAKLTAWLSAPGLADRLSAEGTITPYVGGPALDLDVHGEGLSGDSIAGMLKAAGIEPLIHHAALKLHAHAAVTRLANGLGASMAVEGVRLDDADRELAGLDALRISGLEWHPHEMVVAGIDVNKPRAVVRREADGTIVVAGIHLVPVPAPPQSGISVGQIVADPLAGLLRALSLNATFPATIRQINVTGASVAFSDKATRQPMSTVAHADLNLSNLVLGRAAPPAKMDVHLSAEECVDQVAITGSLSASPVAPSLHVAVNADGIRPDRIGNYLPPGIRLALEDGRLNTTVDVDIVRAAGGGEKGSFALGATELRDGAKGEPVFKFDRAAINLARLDSPHRVVAIDEVAFTGFEADLRKAKDGTLFAGGLAIAPTAPGTSATKPTAPAAPPLEAPTSRLSAAPVAVAAAGAPTTLPSAAQVLQRLPLVTLDRLNVELSRVRYLDESRRGSASLVLSRVTVRNSKRIELLGDDPDSRPPVAVRVTGAVDPIVGAFLVDARLTPFASRPTLSVDLTASAIRGTGLTDWLPEMKEQLDGADLSEGRFHAHLEAQAKLQPARPVGFDLSKPIEAEFVLNQVEFREKADGPVLAGVEEVRADGIRYTPSDGNLLLHSVEITKPQGRAFRDKDGLHVAGMVLKLPPELMTFGVPDTQPAKPHPAVASPPPPPAAPAIAPVASVRPAHEIRIDKLTISGADIRFEDRVMDPPLDVPVQGLDFEARDVSNLATFEDRPFRFSLLANSGKVALPSRNASSGTEQRELFAQVASSGALSLYPATKGWAKSSLNAVDLSGFRGVAHALGVTLNAGNLDASTDLRFPGDGSIQTRSKFVLTDLSVDEPPDGPIQRALKLPIPLDGAIKVMQDPDGGITIPISAPVEKGKVESVGGQMVGAVASVVITAIASAPVKGVNALAGIVGLDVGKGKDKLEPIMLPFAAGDAVLSTDDTRALAVLLKKLRDDKSLEVTLTHVLNEGDVSRAAVRANPSPDTCLLLATQLRTHKAELVATRTTVAGEARGELAAWSGSTPAPSAQRLRQIDRELAQTEDALDRLYELLRPGADRQTPRRTRAACLEMGSQRLDAVRDAIHRGAIPGIDQRIHIIHPTFAPTPDQDGGHVVVVLTKKRG